MKADALKEIRLLPPLAISRLGDSPEPVNNYDLVIPDDQPLGYRQIVPAPTLVVDEASGKITARETRPVVIRALEMAERKRVHRPWKRHGVMPV